MGKLLLAIWVFLGSLMRAIHQPTALHTAQPTVLSIVSPSSSLTPMTFSPSQMNLSTYPFPITNPTPLDTSHWVTYLDRDNGIKFQYPNGWEFYSPSSEGTKVAAFKPAHATTEDLGGNAYPVAAALLVFNYQKERQRLLDGTYDVEPIIIANLPGVYFRSATSGYYLLNKNGQAVEFSYLIINGRDYGQEAEQMAKSLVFLGK